MIKARTDVRIGAASPGNAGLQKQLKNNEKALAKQQINIAKELFLTWDGDGEGSLSPEELMNAFVKVGLSQDHHFAKKIIESIRPSGSDKNEDIQIPDFVKIFRHDEVSDNVTKQIFKEVQFRKKQEYEKSIRKAEQVAERKQYLLRQSLEEIMESDDVSD